MTTVENADSSGTAEQLIKPVQLERARLQGDLSQRMPLVVARAVVTYFVIGEL